METNRKMNVFNLRTFALVLSILTVSMLGALMTPAVAGATYDEKPNEEVEVTTEPITGSITVCKAIVDGEGKVVDGTGVSGTFELSGLDFNSPDGVLPTSQFSTPLSYNADVFAGVDGNDVQCVTYTDLALGQYFYDEEVIDGDNWLEAKYNDQHKTAVEDIDDFFTYSDALFTPDAGDDEARNTNSDGNIVLNENRPDRTLIVLNTFEVEEEPEITYAPYCGDGEVNQSWEQCDGGEQCTAQCLSGTQCVDIALARVNVEETENWGTGDVTSDIFLGGSANRIPAGMWFLLSQNGVPVVDNDMTSDGYENVPGISVERQPGSVRTLLHGSHAQAEGTNKEHANGNLEFWGSTVVAQASDNSGNNKLEKGFDGNVSLSAGQDEVWIEDANVLQSYFWLTVTSADDGFITTYDDASICGVNLVATKVMCESEDLLPNWGAGGPDITDSTAIDYVEEHDGCWLEEDWSFQYGDQSASNPGDNTGEADSGWTTFGPTNIDGVASTVIEDVTDITRLWVREVFENGFVPFTHAFDKSDISAEMYCESDVLHFDNYDYISNPEAGGTYNCVAFNAPETGEPENPDNSCPFEPKDGRIIIDFEDGKKVMSVDGYTYSGPVDTFVPAGTYKVSLASFDGYDGRSLVSQSDERWTLHLRDGFEFVAASGPSTDLPDGVDYVAQVDVVDEELVVATDSNVAKAWHVIPPEEADNANSVEPVCAALDAIEITENQKPVITLRGDNTVELYVGETYIEEEADVEDFEDGDIDEKLVIAGDIVDTNIAGTYVVTYNATDTQNLAADEVTRDVIVKNNVDRKACSDRLDNDGDGLIDKLDPGCHTDGDPTNNSSYDPQDDDEYNEVPYAPYCGDGIVNQEWEDCDGGLECTAQCQLDNQCVERAFARVNTNEFENHSNGDVSSDVFLGSLTNKIPGSAWFLLYDNGTYSVDSDISGYEDVPGLAVQRLEGKIRTLLHGSHGNDGSKEHINGDVEFFNIEIIEQLDDSSGNNKLENGFDMVMDNIPSQDEVWLKDDNDLQSFFWLTVTTGDDAFYTRYGDAPMCEATENTAPVITIVGDNPLILNQFGTYTDPGATALDNEDGDITDDISVGGDSVDPNVIGTYFVTYDVSDSEGLAATTATRTVSVIDDEDPAECSDQIDNDEDGATDSEDAGCWTDPTDPESYDPNDNDENNKPVISLIGGNIEIDVNDSYSDEGATANDAEDGDITSDIVTAGSVDTSTAGTYVITYNVSDSDGLAADEVSRTVTVSQPSTPGGCTSNCGGGGGGGGGGPIPNNLKIFNEKITVIGEGTALITWETNKPASSRVVYDDDSQTLDVATLNFGTGSENLGYEFTTDNNPALTLEHSMIVTNVNLEDLFYFRPISSDGTRAIGVELSAVLGQVSGGTCEQYLFEFIRFGSDNNPEEVRKLQVFLNDFEGFDLEVNGVYDVPTFEAVEAFQLKYGDDVLNPWGLQTDTGYVYLTTRKKINEIYCNFQLPFPLTAEQQAEVNQFKTLLETLEANGQPLPDTSNVGFNPSTPTFAGGDDAPSVTLTEETDENGDALAEGDGTDSLAAAADALAAGDGIFSKIGNFFKNLFR